LVVEIRLCVIPASEMDRVSSSHPWPVSRSTSIVRALSLIGTAPRKLRATGTQKRRPPGDGVRVGRKGQDRRARRGA
jgi:hypothetical protein